jgi:hypothetical protein
MTRPPSPGLAALAAIAWADREQPGAQRADELARELGQILAHARAASAANRFDDEPFQFAAVLARLATPQDGGA